MENQECIYCKTPLTNKNCNLTYVFEDKLKDLAFCPANCRENFIELFQGVRDNINSQFKDNKKSCKLKKQPKSSNP